MKTDNNDNEKIGEDANVTTEIIKDQKGKHGQDQLDRNPYGKGWIAHFPIDVQFPGGC